MAPTSFPRYREMPAELQLMIRRMAIDAQLDPQQNKDATCEQVCRRQIRSPNTPCHHVSHLASVSKEWQDDVEKRSFRRITLRFNVHEEDGLKDFLDFAGIVTGHRRRFIVHIHIRCVISSVEAPISNHTLSRHAEYDHCKANTFHRCVRGLYDVLKYWAVEDVRDDLLKIRFFLSLDRHSTPPTRAPPVVESIGTDLSSLPTLKVVRCMKVLAKELGIFVTPADALLQIYRATPSLTSVGASLHPYCCEGDSDFLPMIQDFCNELQTAAPRLTKLALQIPSWPRKKRAIIYKSCPLHGSLGQWQRSGLVSPLVVTLRDVSYRLERLCLSIVGDPLPLFESFLKEPYDPDSVSLPSWPALRTLVLNSTLVFTKDEHVASAYDDHEERILLAMGRAIRNMPKLKELSATTSYFTDIEDKKHACKLEEYFTAIDLHSSRSESCTLTITCGLYAPFPQILKTFDESLACGPRLSATISVVVLKEASSTGDDADQEADDEVHEEDHDEVHEEDEVHEADDEVYEEDHEVHEEDHEVYEEDHEVYEEDHEVYEEDHEVYEEDHEVYEEDHEVHDEDDESDNGKVIYLNF